MKDGGRCGIGAELHVDIVQVVRGPCSPGARSKGNPALVSRGPGDKRILKNSLGWAWCAIDVGREPNGHIGIAAVEPNEDLCAMELAAGHAEGGNGGIADLGAVPVQRNMVIVGLLGR